MEYNVLNSEMIEAYLRGFGSGEGGAETDDQTAMGDYMVIALKNGLMKDASLFDVVEEYPADAPDWLTPEKFAATQKGGKKFVAFNPDKAEKLKQQIDHIYDWIAGAVQEGDEWIKNVDGQGRPKKLLQITSIKDATSRADKMMLKKANSLRAQFGKAEQGDTDPFLWEELGGHIKTVLPMADGYRFVQLLTVRALDKESAQLDHCIGLGGYDEKVKQTQTYQYYSLRDEKNTPCVTLEVENGELLQCEGKRHASIYKAALHKLIKHHDWHIMDYFVNSVGLIKREGVYYDICNLPDGFTMEGDLYFTGHKDMTHLPDNMTVSGDVDLSESINLTHLPDNLSVGENLSLRGCINLTHLPDNFTVAGDIYWGNEVYGSVEEFRAAFEKIHPPERTVSRLKSKQYPRQGPDHLKRLLMP